MPTPAPELSRRSFFRLAAVAPFAANAVADVIVAAAMQAATTIASSRRSMIVLSSADALNEATLRYVASRGARLSAEHQRRGGAHAGQPGA